MSISATIKKHGLEHVMKYLYKDPETNLVKLIDWADNFCKGEYHGNADHCNWTIYASRCLIKDTDSI